MGVLLRRKWLIIVAVAVAAGVAVVLATAQTKVYAATATIAEESDDPASPATQVEIMRSHEIAVEVSNQLAARSPLVSAIHIAAVHKSHVISITTESADRTVARDAANVYAKVYVEARRNALLDTIQELGASLLQRAQQAKREVDDLDSRIATATRANPSELPALRTQRDAAFAKYTVAQQRSDKSSTEVPLSRGAVRVLQEARLPTDPVRPRPVRNLIAGLVLGLGIGILAAFVFEWADDALKNADGVERNARGLRVLGAIPAVAGWKDRARARLISVEDPTAAASVSYAALAKELAFLAPRGTKKVAFTSASAGDGKTATVANVAMTLARAGRKVICVDCDLRTPRLHEFFGLPSTVGFTSVLLGDNPLSSALQPVTVAGPGSLRLLAAGPLPPNADELLATARVTELLTAIAADAEIVLIDAPAALAVPDAGVLASRVDGVVIVVAPRTTGRRRLTRVIDLIEDHDGDPVGLVLNGLDRDETRAFRPGAAA